MNSSASCVQFAAKAICRRASNKMNDEIATYNDSQSDDDRFSCVKLAGIINRVLQEAQSKIRHAHPVWFLNGDPVVGYSELKDRVQLLFWSGQSSDEPGLHPQRQIQSRRRTVHVGQSDQSQRPDSLAEKGPRHPVGLPEHREAKGRFKETEVVR